MATSLDITVLTGRCIDALRQQGFVTRQSSDFNEVEAILGDLGQTSFPPRLSPHLQDLPRSNTFWLIAETLQGAPVAAVGARLDQLGGETLDVYWLRQLSRVTNREVASVDPGQSPPVARHISGNTVFLTDIIQKSPAKSRPRFDAEAFCALAVGLTMMQWSVDWFYAFGRNRGCAVASQMPRGYPLLAAPEDRGAAGMMFCMDIDDAHFMIEAALERKPGG